MNLYVYLPWPDDKRMIGPADMFVQRINKQKYDKYKDADLIAQEHLKDVKPDDVVYIAGHGEAGNENIYGTMKQSMTAVELANQFQGKLKSQHKKIKVWVCFSGDGMQDGKGLAYKFWQAMHPSFPQLSVFGYRFAVLDPLAPSQEHLAAAKVLPGFKNLSETPDLLEFLPGSAQHWRIGIGPGGEVIPPKPLPRGKTGVDADSTD